MVRSTWINIISWPPLCLRQCRQAFCSLQLSSSIGKYSYFCGYEVIFNIMTVLKITHARHDLPDSNHVQCKSFNKTKRTTGYAKKEKTKANFTDLMRRHQTLLADNPPLVTGRNTLFATRWSSIYSSPHIFVLFPRYAVLTLSCFVPCFFAVMLVSCSAVLSRAVWLGALLSMLCFDGVLFSCPLFCCIPQKPLPNAAFQAASTTLWKKQTKICVAIMHRNFTGGEFLLFRDLRLFSRQPFPWQIKGVLLPQKAFLTCLAYTDDATHAGVPSAVSATRTTETFRISRIITFHQPSN